MKTISNKFDPKNITYTYNLKAILKLHKENKLFDFLERIYPNHHTSFDGVKIKQQDILETWIKHFENLNIPYAITSGTTKVGDYLVLWKEQRI